MTGTLEGRVFAGQLGDLSLSRSAGATMATLTGTLKGAGLPAAGARFTATADVKVSAVDPVAPPQVMPPVVPPVDPPVVPPVAPRDTQPIVPPVIQVPGMCTVLQLDVDNLHLDLLGLVVLIPDPGLHLIVGGAPRDGALLGNLLCNLAGGLDQRTPAQPVGPVPVQPVAPAA